MEDPGFRPGLRHDAAGLEESGANLAGRRPGKTVQLGYPSDELRRSNRPQSHCHFRSGDRGDGYGANGSAPDDLACSQDGCARALLTLEHEARSAQIKG
jgi:hypothetical protein